ncbi:hypothetical protein RRG08_018182 [Elysia crispata]|uniref:Uncharacterized protein n=1 Tax=Elysia crispata TaxID=231223 RepID=A0AAE0ZYH8_9GAST|nr:hypothetical protein RRG08_018182 [Elysia crispata]
MSQTSARSDVDLDPAIGSKIKSEEVVPSSLPPVLLVHSVPAPLNRNIHHAFIGYLTPAWRSWVTGHAHPQRSLVTHA